jgi:histone chaperone ASF1
MALVNIVNMVSASSHAIIAHQLRLDPLQTHTSHCFIIKLFGIATQLVLDNPTQFTSPFSFEITFECLQELDDDLEWRILYVGSARDCDSDVCLDEILVGPVPVGTNKFVLEADAPDASKLEDVLGVTVVLVTCSYREREFIRVGYYVNNEYTEEYDEAAGPPMPLDITKVHRQILADKPRVTKFPIPWGDGTEVVQQPQEELNGTQDTEDTAEMEPEGDDNDDDEENGEDVEEENLVPNE